MINCIIVDDEQHAIDLLTEHVSKVPTLKLVFHTTDAIKAFQYVQENPVDLVFLDIHMPELNGLQFLKLLGSKSKVILTTAYPEYALEGYEHNIIDYLLKPIFFDRFFKAANKAFELFQGHSLKAEGTKNPDFVFIKANQKLEKIFINDILFVEGMANYVVIHTTAGKYVVYLTFKGVEENLPSEKFVRIHKSYLVPISKIKTIDSDEVVMGDQRLPLSRHYKEEVLSKIDAFLFKRS